MKLSIITICYNDKAGFRKTALSVATQSKKDFEWIVIDGASTDGSVDVIKRYNDYITFWMSEKDKGIYNAMNKGIAHANGEYLLFLNSGDCLYDEHVVEMVLPMLNGKDVYVGDVVNDLPIGRELTQFPRELTPQVVLDQIVFKLIPHQASFIRRDLFERYGLYREDLRIASDWYFFYKTLVIEAASIQSLAIPIAIFDCNGISSTDTNRVNERITSQDGTPCQQVLYCFYRSNKDIVDAINANVIGRLIIRVYYFLYRKLSRH